MKFLQSFFVGQCSDNSIASLSVHCENSSVILIMSKIHFIIYVFTLILIASCNGNTNSDRLEVHKNSLAKNIGKKFELSGILDSTGHTVLLDFSKSDITIIDFWFNNCPPCIEEMNQFAGILSGKEKKVTVISISINQFGVWESILKTHTGKFAFLNNEIPNWSQYVLQAKDDEKLHNEISVDRLIELQRDFNVTFFPAYFVVDKGGKILVRPVSAVDYIKSL